MIVFFSFIILFLAAFIFFAYVFYRTGVWRIFDEECTVEQKKQTKNTEI